MKKIKGILSLVVAMMIAVTLLAGCGGGKATGYEGKYVSVSGEAMGIELTGEEIEGWAIELKNGGKGTMTLEGDTANIDWSIEGETITIKVEGEEMTGTIKDGNIVIDNTLGLGMKLTFAKED